jgi:hypothetical protein
MTTTALLLLGLAALLPIVFGVRYLLTKDFMPYHAVVAGKAWTELDGGVQTIVLGMLRIVGGGLISYGLATLWFLLPLSRGEPWAIWAILTGATLYVTVWLRKVQPKANTPIAPTAVCLALVLAGVGAALLQ